MSEIDKDRAWTEFVEARQAFRANRDGLKARIMAAAKHLSNSRMAWVVGRFIGSTYSFQKCSKGLIADVVVREMVGSESGMKNLDEEDAERLLASLRGQENARGEKGN